MDTPFILRRALQAILPATLLLASCSKSDTPAPAPAVADQGKVLFINAASHVAPTTLKFLVDNTEKASLAYGVRSDYQTLPTGSRSVQVTSGTQTALTQSITVDKDKTYTFVATPAASSTAVGGMIFPDDLTAPAAGKARIRVIHLGQSVSSPVRLSQVTSTVTGPVVADIVANVGLNTASAFTEFNAGTYGLSILDNSTTASVNPLAQVGDGSGTGTGTKNYEAGKIYTVVVSGTAGSLNAEQKLRAFVSQNN